MFAIKWLLLVTKYYISNMILIDMPPDVRAYILKVQADIKIKKGLGKFSQQLTIFHVIREHQKVNEDKKDKT